jgi:osmotically-inducible protein OsmY
MKDDQNQEAPDIHRSGTRMVRQTDGGTDGALRGVAETASSAAVTSSRENLPNDFEHSAPAPPDTIPKDEIIRGRILGALERHPASVPTDLVLAVGGGVVFIDGFVSTLADKHLIERLIASVPGVRSVRNNLDIAPHRPRNDEAIADAVRTSLEEKDGLDTRCVRVEVQRGTVTLVGRVPDEGTRNGVLAGAASVPGVRQVRDHLQPAAARLSRIQHRSGLSAG